MTCCGISAPYHTINTLISYKIYFENLNRKMHVMYFRGEWKQWRAFNSCQHSNGRFSRRWKPTLCLLTAQPDGGGHGQRQLLLLIPFMVIDKVNLSKNGILLSCICAATHSKETTLLLSVFSKCRSLSIFLLLYHF